MKKYLLIAILLFTVLGVSPKAYSFVCGIKPFAPLGCIGGYAVCSCDKVGNCKWLWVCN